MQSFDRHIASLIGTCVEIGERGMIVSFDSLDFVSQRWRVNAWTVYLIGLPAWIIIFISERNWIAAALEAGGAPAMVLGLVVALRGKGKAPKWLDYIALIAIMLGLSYSWYDFGGVTTINQWLELGMVTGFLSGTYLLAKERPVGYLCFLLMVSSNLCLMWIQDYPWLALQQLISLGFILDAFFAERRKSKSLR